MYEQNIKKRWDYRKKGHNLKLLVNILGPVTTSRYTPQVHLADDGWVPARNMEVLKVC